MFKFYFGVYDDNHPKIRYIWVTKSQTLQVFKGILFLCFIFQSYNSYGQDTMYLCKDIYKVDLEFQIIKDNSYDRFEAFSVLSKKHSKTYQDWGKSFRSYNSYWTGGVLVNTDTATMPIMVEGNISELYIDGIFVQSCSYILCRDSSGLIKQPQLHASYFNLSSGSHTILAKIEDFHLKKKFNPKISDRRSFESLAVIKESNLVFIYIFFGGIFFILAVITLLLFFEIRDWSFFYYAIFCISLLIHNMRSLGETYEVYFNIDGYIPWCYSKMVISYFLYFSYFKFGVTYIKANVRYKHIDQTVNKILKVLILCLIPEAILLMLGLYKESYTFYFLLRSLTNIAAIYVLTLLYKEKKDILVLFIFIGGSSLMLSEIVTSYFNGIAIQIAGFIGLVFEMIVFSAALTYKVYHEYFQVLVLENENAKKNLEIERLEKEKTILNFNTLQAQLNPHFIFNSMNSIREFIISDQSVQASNYLAKFASLMRKILDFSTQESILLHEEIDITKQYLDFFLLMSPHKISYEIVIEEEVEADMTYVPPLILQPYIENIFKHAFDSKVIDPKIHILFYEQNEKLFIEIIDNGVGFISSKNNKTYHDSKGMAITKDRIVTWGKYHHTSCNVEVFDLYNGAKRGGTKIRIII